MRKLRLAHSVAIVALAAAAVIAPSVQGQERGPIEGEFTFAWWGGQARADKTDRILRLFEAENPDVSIERQNSDWGPYWDRLTIEAAAGNVACTLMMQNRFLDTYADPRVLLPLDQFIEDGTLDLSGIPESTIQSARGADGSLYFVPSSVFFNGVMFNRTWLQEAGIPEPDPYWTWDDLADLLRQVQDHVPDGAVPAHNIAMELDQFVSWVQSQGDQVFDEDGRVAFSLETMQNWFQFWEDLRLEGLTDNPEVMVEESGNLIEQSDIANGRAFLTGRPPNRLDSHQQVIDTVRPGEELAILPSPTGPAGGGWDVGSTGIAIGANCPENLWPAAVAWINFFTQEEQASAIYESDMGPVAVDSLQQAQIDDPQTSRGQREVVQMFRQIAPDAKPVLWPANGNPLLQQALTRNYQAIAFGMVSVEEGAMQVFEDMRALER